MPAVARVEPEMRRKRAGLDDSTIRLALRTRLLAEHGQDADTVVIEELGLRRGHVRIDVAVVNSLLHGYEIKSDRDSLRRLNTQIDVYGRVLDRATLVVGDRFLADALDIVPAWWGVLYVHSTSHGLQFSSVRSSRRNPQRDPRVLVELLWSDQALALLEERSNARGVHGKPRRVVWDRVCDRFGVDEIAAAVRDRLKARLRNQAPA